MCIIIVDLPLLQEILNSFGIDLQSGGMLEKAEFQLLKVVNQ